MKYNNSILLIGPCRSGKSTVGNILANRLNKPNISLDAVGYNFIKEIYNKDDEDLYKQYLSESKYSDWISLTRKYEFHVVQRALSEYNNCIIDFGAGHSVYDDLTFSNAIKELLFPYKYIFLLFPTSNIEKAMEILLSRYVEPLHIGTADYLIHHTSYFELSKYQIYTENQSPDETANNIITILKNTGYFI